MYGVLLNTSLHDHSDSGWAQHYITPVIFSSHGLAQFCSERLVTANTSSIVTISILIALAGPCCADDRLLWLIAFAQCPSDISINQPFAPLHGYGHSSQAQCYMVLVIFISQLAPLMWWLGGMGWWCFYRYHFHCSVVAGPSSAYSSSLQPILFLQCQLAFKGSGWTILCMIMIVVAEGSLTWLLLAWPAFVEPDCQWPVTIVQEMC
jgi:hypothetical protein